MTYPQQHNIYNSTPMYGQPIVYNQNIYSSPYQYQGAYTLPMNWFFIILLLNLLFFLFVVFVRIYRI
jgi:hypothetical protein